MGIACMEKGKPMKIEARPWTPQDLLDDLRDIIDDEPDNYLNTRRTTLRMALSYLEEHFSESKWIPVTERLPEQDGWYIVYTKNKGDTARRFNKAQYYHYSWHGNGGRWDNVTHWMPLPEPPKRD
jgi:hypothetical protein